MIGDNIRKCRKYKGLTLEQLAALIDSSSGSLSHIEKGTRKPSFDMIDKIAAALDVTQEQLVSGQFDTVENSKTEHLINVINKMDKDKLITTENILKVLYPELF